ncbi:MAG: type III effector protein, partial [Streptomycetaceae bacterium]|nr:type III effector protein [Streptomycetaceae bacterium]
LRRIAGQIAALTDLPTAAHHPLSQLHAALAQDDPAALIHPLNATRPHLTTTHPDLAAQLDILRNSAAPPTASPK